jgi:hypothetical protein
MIYESRPVKWHIYPENDSTIYSETGYTVEIEDEAGGEFVKITSNDDRDDLSFDHLEGVLAVLECASEAFGYINQTPEDSLDLDELFEDDPWITLI